MQPYVRPRIIPTVLDIETLADLVTLRAYALECDALAFGLKVSASTGFGLGACVRQNTKVELDNADDQSIDP